MTTSSISSLAEELVGDTGAMIIPHLYIGDKRFAANLDAIKALGITRIVNCTVDIRHYFESLDESQGHLPIEYLRCPCHDTELADVSVHFDAAYQFIHQAIHEGHSVLVHCQLGVSRSATVVIAYLIRSRGLSLSEAYTLVRTRRDACKPNPNFLRQLMKYANSMPTKTAIAPAPVPSLPPAPNPGPSAPTSATFESASSTVAASASSSPSLASTQSTTGSSTVSATASSSTQPTESKKRRATEEEITLGQLQAAPDEAKDQLSNEKKSDQIDRDAKRQKVDPIPASGRSLAPPSKPTVSASPPPLASLAMYADSDED